ncbi:MAG: hypothetical protein A3J81_03960 [Nitrospirae bacterium RIFOXYB2_FULL_43_5]|nr:MAG: hypothetical protein A2X54_07520 [Nitrospirae bacterium GWF2_44_13]OGW77717.1 MAG: hypothetical protein A3J81_03960 [Nitrospirae bacterium RIFOXYB2_FULL_43_5]HBG91907.1 hypothetical protein [Nitrospiraceae bacterium]
MNEAETRAELIAPKLKESGCVAGKTFIAFQIAWKLFQPRLGVASVPLPAAPLANSRADFIPEQSGCSRKD